MRSKYLVTIHWLDYPTSSIGFVTATSRDEAIKQFVSTRNHGQYNKELSKAVKMR